MSMSHEEQLRENKRIRREDSRRYIGLAVSYSPESVLEDAQRVVYEDGSWNLAKATEKIMGERYLELFNRPLAAVGLVHSNVRDVGTLVQHIADAHPNKLSLETLIRIATHPQTIGSIALTASQRSTMSFEMLGKLDQFYQLSPEQDALYTDSGVMPEPFGSVCPASDLHRNGEPWPIFTRFARWAGELTAREIYALELSSDNETPALAEATRVDTLESSQSA